MCAYLFFLYAHASTLRRRTNLEAIIYIREHIQYKSISSVKT